MRILAFDTATRSTSVALVDSEVGLELEARDDPPAGQRPGHARRLMPLIVELLERAGGGWEAIDRIAVGVGPGSFTGLRIGVATARALALAREIPLVGVSTLQSVAMNAAVAGSPAGTGHSHEAVIAVLDARRGEVFAAAWRIASDVLAAPLLAPRALAPEELGRLVVEIGHHPLALGSGAVEFRSALERSGATIPADHSGLHRVTSLHHCQLAAGLRVADPAADIRPEYLRLPDAELARRLRSATTGRQPPPSDSRE